MFSGRVLRAVPRSRAALAARRLPAVQHRTFIPDQIQSRELTEEKYPEYPKLSEAEDPEMNGGYVNPPRIKRQFRDPHADWWDKQERRNFGEPVHEDNDMLGMFSPYEYTWIKPGKGAVQVLAVILVFAGIVGVVKISYPDKPAFPREFEGGLDRELGGPGALRARKSGDPFP